jgi:hypothetical protein
MTPEALADIPPGVAAELGSPVAEFEASGREQALAAAVGGLVLGVGLVASCVGLWFVLRGPGWQGLVKEGLVKAVLLGPLFVGIGLHLLIKLFRNRGLRVLVFPHGLVCLRRGQAVVCRWDDVEEVWQDLTDQYTLFGLVHRPYYYYTLRLRDGSRVRFDHHLQDVRRLGDTVLRQTFPQLLRRALGALQAGEVLSYGGLTVSRHGLGNGKHVVPWGEVQQVGIYNGRVLVARGGKWLKWGDYPVKKVPNVHVLLELVRRLRASAASHSSLSP